MHELVGRPGTGAPDHCWHLRGVAPADDGKQGRLMCCWCGQEDYYSVARAGDREHGPHAPPIFYAQGYVPHGPCPRRAHPVTEYWGTRVEGDVPRVDVVVGQQYTLLPPRHDLANHSPDGFEWGYLGSGPAQLALALCAHATGDDQRALRVYQRVKETLVAKWSGDNWTATVDGVLKHVGAAEAGLRPWPADVDGETAPT